VKAKADKSDLVIHLNITILSLLSDPPHGVSLIHGSMSLTGFSCAGVVVSGSGTSKLADAGGLALLSTLMYVVTCQAGEGGPGLLSRVACGGWHVVGVWCGCVC